MCFFSSIICVCLLGQESIPVTIIGDVYVGDMGIMKSAGPMHLKANAEVNGKVARIANYGNLKLGSAIFYTNDFTDGLLMNQTSDYGSYIVTADEVLVRKSFVNSNYWYMTSFPFDVDVATGIKYNGINLTYQNHYWIQYYDPEKRADRGINDEENWITYGYNGVPEVTTLMKGTAYRIAVLLTKLPGITTLPTDTIGAYAGRFNVDFFAKSPADIEYLFEPQAKGCDLTFARSFGKFLTTNSEGWNAIGGLNSTNFLISASPGNTTMQYNDPSVNKTIYYRVFDDPYWNELDPTAETGTLRPYGVIFLKTDSETELSRLAGGGFIFLDGITLNSSSPIFRSSNDASINVLRLELTDAENSSNLSRIYFKFNDGFNRLYYSTEDGIRLETGNEDRPEDRPNRPIVWSLAKNEKESDIVLFSNCLPLGDNEIPLGAYVPAAGEYIISLKDISNEAIKKVVLWDKETDSKVDLLKQNYTFNANNTFNRNDRFVVFFSDVITAIDPFLQEASIYAYADNNILTVRNLLQGDKVQVLDLTGLTIASGVASGDVFSVSLNKKGVYIVNAKEGKILKVFNK